MDLDIDVPQTFKPITLFPSRIEASMVNNGKLVRHPCGVYLQNIPQDQVTNLAAIPYKHASDYGYFKIDFLHLTLLEHVTSKQEIQRLIRQEPNWNMLQDPEVVPKLFQLHRSREILQQVKPTNVQQLADCIALIRPNKKHLLNEYLKNPDKVRSSIYRDSSDDKSSFRRSHAIAYALTIVLQLHLIAAGKI